MAATVRRPLASLRFGTADGGTTLRSSAALQQQGTSRQTQKQAQQYEKHNANEAVIKSISFESVTCNTIKRNVAHCAIKYSNTLQ